MNARRESSLDAVKAAAADPVATAQPSEKSKRPLLWAGLLMLAAGGVAAAVWWYWPGSLAAVELDSQKQRDIWEAEHVTFKMESRFGKPFAAAIQERDEQRLLSFMRPDFQATVLEKATDALTTQSVVSERRRNAETAHTQSVDAAGFVRYLLSSVSDFGQFQRVKLRVLQIEKNSADATRWRSKLLLDAAGSNSRGTPIQWMSEHSIQYRFADESDIGERPVIDRWRVEKEVTRTSGQLLMEEVTGQVGLENLPIMDNWTLPLKAVSQYRLQTAVEDFDRDGYLDIAVGTIEGRPLLLHSMAGRRFEDVVYTMGIDSWQTDFDRETSLAGWIDYDNDGFPDLILGNRLYHNESGQRFLDVTAESGLQFRDHPMGCAVADYDSDGLLDLYVLYQTPPGPKPEGPAPWVGDDSSGGENQLWHNEGGGRFRDVTAESGAGGGRRHSFAASWFFYDDDHHPDLYIANDFGHNVLLRNRGDGTFEDLSSSTAASDFATSMGVTTGDLDNDGSPEIYVANMYSKMGRRIIGHVCAADYPPGLFKQIQGSCTGNRLYRRVKGQRGYEEVSEELGVNGVGWAYAPALVDLDGDGWLDIYATTGFMSFSRKEPDG